jgi:hypothetical protein
VFIKSLIDVPHVPAMICTKAFLGILDRVREMSLLFDRQILGLTLVPFGLTPTSTPTPTLPEKTDQKYDQKNNNFDRYRGGMEDDDYNNDNSNSNSEMNYKNTYSNSNINAESASIDTEHGRKESAEVASKLQSSIRAPAVVSIIVNKDIVG